MNENVLSYREFHKRLNNSNAVEEFTGHSISDSTLIFNNNHLNRGLRDLRFIKCDFSCETFFFESITKLSLNVTFDNCSFKGKLKIDTCQFNSLKFFDTKEIKSIEVINSKFSNFYFKNKSQDSINTITGQINIESNVFSKILNLENLNHSSGSFVFQNTLETKKRQSSNERLNASFTNSHFYNADFSETNFGEETGFDKMILSGNQGQQNFNDCTFGKVYFNGTDFGKYAFFNGSIFNDTTIFNGCKNLNETVIDFSGCEVKDAFNIVYSKFKSLVVKNVTFQKQVSFQNSEFNEVSFENLTFDKQAFFDDVKVNNVEKCDRKSLRTIKYQLQKSDNRIDYNKFKAYELEAYRRELKDNQYKDKFILWLNNFSSNHGLDWGRALFFTLLTGFVFYLLYFTSEHYRLYTKNGTKFGLGDVNIWKSEV